MRPTTRVPGTTRKLLPLSLSIGLAMSGVGIIIPVVPSHLEHLGLANAPTSQVALHVSLLAAGYALMYLLFAPLWGRLSDSLGRRPLLVIGITGFAIGQALCGLATSLVGVYVIRLATGIFSAAIIPAAFAFAADNTTEEERTRGMAQLSAAGGIGFVIGPGLGGLLGGIRLPASGLPVAGFSLPFFAASGFALLALLTLRLIDEPAVPATVRRSGSVAWTELVRRVGLPLVVAMAGQTGIALFETSFALHARTNLDMGLVGIGTVFMTCGLMMLVVQLGVVARLARRFGEVHLASAALALMGLSLGPLGAVRSSAVVFALVALYGTGMGLLAPALSALVSRRGGAHTGAALGLESGAKGLGLIAGPLLGGVLFGSFVAVPFWLASGLLLGLAPIFAWSGRGTGEPRGDRAATTKVAFGGQEAG